MVQTSESRGYIVQISKGEKKESKRVWVKAKECEVAEQNSGEKWERDRCLSVKEVAAERVFLRL